MIFSKGFIVSRKYLNPQQNMRLTIFIWCTFFAVWQCFSHGKKYKNSSTIITNKCIENRIKVLVIVRIKVLFYDSVCNNHCRNAFTKLNKCWKDCCYYFNILIEIASSIIIPWFGDNTLTREDVQSVYFIYSHTFWPLDNKTHRPPCADSTLLGYEPSSIIPEIQFSFLEHWSIKSVRCL